MSAPATKPLFLADMTTTPRGALCASGRSRASSSVSTSLERTLAEVPGLSSVSQTMPSASVEDVQFGLVLMVGSRDGGGRIDSRCLRADVEVANERPVVREAHIGDPEVGHLDALTHQDEI